VPLYTVQYTHSASLHCAVHTQCLSTLCSTHTVHLYTVQYTHSTNLHCAVHTRTTGKYAAITPTYVHVNGHDTTITLILAKDCIEIPDYGSLVIRNMLEHFKYFKYFIIIIILSTNYMFVHLLDNKVFQSSLMQVQT
jgi:hypothetical protein